MKEAQKKPKKNITSDTINKIKQFLIRVELLSMHTLKVASRIHHATKDFNNNNM